MKFTVPILLALVFATAGCSSGDAAGTTTATTPSAPLVTESFSGTVNVGGSDAHTFTTSQTGEVDLTLTAAAPPATIYMGLGIGTPNGVTCVFLTNGTASVQAGSSPQLSGTSITAGTYCVGVYDIGHQAAPVTYSVTVVHP